MVARLRNSPVITQHQVQIEEAQAQVQMYLQHGYDVAQEGAGSTATA